MIDLVRIKVTVCVFTTPVRIQVVSDKAAKPIDCSMVLPGPEQPAKVSDLCNSSYVACGGLIALQAFATRRPHRSCGNVLLQNSCRSGAAIPASVPAFQACANMCQPASITVCMSSAGLDSVQQASRSWPVNVREPQLRQVAGQDRSRNLAT